MSRSLCILFFLCAGLLSSLAVETTPGNEVRAVEEKRLVALTHGDLAVLGGILADDLTYAHSSGVLNTKAELIESLRSGALAYRTIALESQSVRMLGETAIMNGTLRAVTVRAGKENPLHLRYLLVYVHRSGRWQMAAWESTKMP